MDPSELSEVLQDFVVEKTTQTRIKVDAAMASLKEEVNNYVDLKTAELSNDLRQLREEIERRVTETNQAVGNVVTAGTNLYPGLS